MSDTEIERKLTLWAAQQPKTEAAKMMLEAAEEIVRLRGEVRYERAKSELHGDETFEKLEFKVTQWASARKIIPNSKPTAQLLKTVSELGELADATLKTDWAEIEDGVGDVLVTLILYCRLQDIDIIDCLRRAYDTIKDRKGTLTPEGIFVKEGA